MLKTMKNTTITGMSIINDTQVAYLNATIPSDGGASSINKSIANQELYIANKTQVRQDIADFEALVYSIEDEGANA